MSRRVPRDRVVGRDGSVDPNAAQRRLDATADAIDDVASREAVNGVLLRDVRVGVGANGVKTGLGRPAVGYFLQWKGTASLGNVTRDHRNERRPDSEIRLVVHDDRPFWELVGTVTCATASDIVVFQNLDGRIDRSYRWEVYLSASSAASTAMSLIKNAEGTANWRQVDVTVSSAGVTGNSSTSPRLYLHSTASQPERVWMVGEMQADDTAGIQSYWSRYNAVNLGAAGEQSARHTQFTATAHTGSQITTLKFSTTTAGMFLPGSTFSLYRRALPSSGSALADIWVF